MERFHLDEFFTYETTLPRGIGFGMFRVGHFIWLAAILAGVDLDECLDRDSRHLYRSAS